MSSSSKPVTMFSRALVLSSMLCAAAFNIVHAEVKQAAPDNFLITHSALVKAPPAKVYAALSEIGRWWDGEHSYSGDPANLSLKAEAGACFCERWKDGAVEHGRVILALPNKILRLASALGPLQGRALSGVLTFQLKPQEGGTLLELSYVVNGSSASGLEKSAPAVDGVLGEVFARLVRYIETGNPSLSGK